MSESVFTPIKLDNIYLVESFFSLESETFGKECSLNISFDTPEPEIKTSDDHRFACLVPMGVTLKILGDDEDSPSLIMHAKMVASLSIPDDVLSKDEAQEYLWVNGLSMAYAHIRSHMLSLANASPMPKIVIPPIYPDELIKVAKQNKA